MKKNGHACRQAGFTLFELLITISIIGILTAIATISFSSAQKKGRDARRMQDMKNIQTAAEQYYSLNNSTYPLSSALLVAGIGGQKFLEVWPADPKNSDPYIYTSTWTITDYCVCAELENITAGNSGAGCVFAAGGSYYCVKSQQ